MSPLPPLLHAAEKYHSASHLQKVLLEEKKKGSADPYGENLRSHAKKRDFGIRKKYPVLWFKMLCNLLVECCVIRGS